MHNRLYIGNLAAGVAVTTLQELFEPHGFVMDIKLGRGEKAGPPSGFAFVTMATDASANAALRALNGAVLHGAIINIEHASGDGLEPDA